MRKLLTTMAMFAALSWSAEVTGAWSGPMEMTRGAETRQDSAYLVLTQTGNEIKGTLGPNPEKQMPITKGTIEGSQIVLEGTPPSGAGKVTIRLTVEGEKLIGDLTAEGGDGEPFKGKMTLTREK